MEIITIDVSELEPPEPMERILARLRTLQAAQLLRVRHRREPFPLYPILEQSGYEHHCVPRGTDEFLIYIWPHSLSVSEDYCRTDATRDAQ